MRTFFLHIKSPDAVERDETGVECEDLEHAYLLACDAIPDLAAEIMRDRKNPLEYSFLIESEAGDHLMTVPFTELVQERRGPLSGRESELEMAQRHVRQGAERLRRQGEVVERMRASGNDTKASEDLYRLFEQLLWEHRKHLDRLSDLR